MRETSSTFYVRPGLFILPALLLLSVKPVSAVPAHESCLDARDYEGCIKVKSGLGDIAEEQCDENGWCLVTSKSRDIGGYLKLKGWWYKEKEKRVLYVDRNSASRVPHRGQPARYVAVLSASTAYDPGTAPSSTPITARTTKCTDYGNNLNCTTTPGISINRPGISAGWKRIKFWDVVDCKDQTGTFFANGKRKAGWKKFDLSRSSQWFQNVCKNAAELPAKKMKL